MKSQLIGLDPTVQKSSNLDHFLDILALFKRHGVFKRTSIASIVEPSLYTVPYSVYLSLKDSYIKKANQDIMSLTPKDLGPVQILASNSQATSAHVEKLSRYARRINANALILASNDRKGFPYWVLGSFSETASLIASIPVFIIKPTISTNKFSRNVRFILAVDVAAPPTAHAIKWLSDLAQSSRARLYIVYVEPKKRALVDSLQNRIENSEALKALTRLETAFKSNGVQAIKTVLPETKSIAHTIVDFSDKMKAWLTITTAPKRSGVRKLLLGSNARKILRLTERPFLSLRLH